MVAQLTTFAFQGVEARAVTVPVQLGGGTTGFAIVGLPDKAISEARDRVSAALSAIGLPPKRVTVNLAPADLPKEGGHFDLAIALGLLMEMGAARRRRGFCRHWGIGARRLGRARQWRAAGGGRRERAWPRPYLPYRQWPRSRVGRARHRNPYAKQPNSARQPFQRNAGAVGACPGRLRRRVGGARHQRGEGSAKRQARARGGGCRRAQSSDGRPAGGRQVDAGAASGRACGKGPLCEAHYQSRVSGPMLDRIDIVIDLAPVTPADLSTPATGEASCVVGARVAAARALQNERSIAETGRWRCQRRASRRRPRARGDA